jgi:2-oxoglutarate ferredoxin oxidoreductase subunit alpha
MKRLLVKWETARGLVPAPRTKINDPACKTGLIFFGTSTHSTYEAISRLADEGRPCNSLRIRAFPFHDEVLDFIERHETLFVIEQNRDAQMRTLLINECGTCRDKLQSILNIDGLPITANFITDCIRNPPPHNTLEPFPKQYSSGEKS